MSTPFTFVIDDAEAYFRFRDSVDRSRIVDLTTDNCGARGLHCNYAVDALAASRNENLEIVIASFVPNRDDEASLNNSISLRELFEGAKGPILVSVSENIGEAARLDADSSEFEVIEVTESLSSQKSRITVEFISKSAPAGSLI